MKAVGKAVINGHPGIPGQEFHGGLLKPPELDGVKHPAQDPGGVFDRFLCPKLNVLGRQKHRMPPLFPNGGFKGATGPGGTLFKKQGYGFSHKALVDFPIPLFSLEFPGQVQKIADFIHPIIQQGKKGPAP
jgi:hypothetical protein